MSTDNNTTTTKRTVPALNYEAYQAGLANYSESEQELVTWLWGYYNGAIARDQERLCKELGFEWIEAVRPVFTGRCPAAIHEEIFGAIAALKTRESRRKPLVRTIVAERIIQALDYARDYSKMVYITGPTGRGKTYSAQWWAAENNHGRTKYIRVPSDCSRRALVTNLCRICGFPAYGTTPECEELLRKHLGPRNVIIVDEAGHLLSKSGKPGGAIEFLRDLHDMVGCAVALIFTDVYLAEIKRGRNADYFEQFLGRLEFPVEIPKIPRRDEVRQALQAYFANPSESLVEYALNLSRNRDGQLRTLYNDLARAEAYATEQHRPVAEEDFKLFVRWRKTAGAWPEDK